MSVDIVLANPPVVDLRDAPIEVKRLVLAGRCMAHALEEAGIRPDLVAAWAHCAEDVSGRVFYDAV